jgi:hypothetical protein
LVPQEDYFVDKLTDISTKFNAHFMTKQNKLLKQEKEDLERLKGDMVML